LFHAVEISTGSTWGGHTPWYGKSVDLSLYYESLSKNGWGRLTAVSWSSGGMDMNVAQM
jgi:hypothetical protein